MDQEPGTPESEKKITLDLPIHVYEKLQERVSASKEFSSVSDYLLFVIKEILGVPSEGRDKDLGKEDQQRIEERLRSLGYL